MPSVSVAHAILGGLCVACGAALLLLASGRIAGVGGAFGGVLTGDNGKDSWRLLFLFGIVVGGAAATLIVPAYADVGAYDRPMALVLLSGALMGFGGKMCNGCTSGHGVCGIARLSLRSTVATATFFGTTLLTLYVCRHVLGWF